MKKCLKILISLCVVATMLIICSGCGSKCALANKGFERAEFIFSKYGGATGANFKTLFFRKDGTFTYSTGESGKSNLRTTEGEYTYGDDYIIVKGKKYSFTLTEDGVTFDPAFYGYEEWLYF